MFLVVQRAPLVFNFCPLPLVLSLPKTERNLAAYSLQIFFIFIYIYIYIKLYIQIICIIKILPKPFLGLSHSSLSLSLCERCFSPSVVWVSQVDLHPSCTEEPRPGHNGFCFAGKCRHDYFIYKSWCWVFRTRRGGVRRPADTRKPLQ